MTAPQAVDLADFARQDQVRDGEVLVSHLPRLQDVVASATGTLHYHVEGALTARREPRIVCIIRGFVTLTCQRCLTVFDHPLDVRSTLIFVADESQLPALEEEEESIDYLVAQPMLDIAALLEEEVILALPVVPRHPVGTCDASVELTAVKDKPSPFARLAGLKRS